MSTWFPAGYFRRHVLLPLLIAFSLLALSLWFYGTKSDLGSNAVVTTGTVQEVLRGGPDDDPDGQTGIALTGRVGYVADGRQMVGLISLGSCTGTTMCAMWKPGDTIEVAYDPADPADVRRAPHDATEITPALAAGFLALIGLVCLYVAAINIMDRRPVRR
ncbi:hypothetical protein Pth03_33490 [Planotetraspora thailandica]|uniref:DUF3592 domain-containing protein n=1 Tax=Planotetraspora thailandica TaxID=487172 RepID=A0A8J3VCM9_9ACTN|nr:DUF3592 domain-containing protein [Planotetraspora thailandica]GII54960.1 hypothetical protein Pth03_33490 [Planotetraspora thailandica]